MSQKQIADRIDLTAGAIGMVESGERKTPTGETLLRLARVYGTTVEYLLRGEGEEPTKESVHSALGMEVDGSPVPTFPVASGVAGTHGVG